MSAIRQKSLKLNFIMNALLSLSNIIFPLITFPYVSRILLPDGMGKIAFATSIISYFIMLSQLGIPVYGIRACAKVRDNKLKLTRVVHEIFILNLIITIITYFVFILALKITPKLNYEKELFTIISFSIIFNTLGMEWLYKALEKYSYITIRSIIFKFIALVAMFLFIKNKEDYLIYGAISIFASSASNILNFINSRKYIYFAPVDNYSIIRHLKPILIFFAMSFATIIYTHLDTIMLGFITTNIDVGYYTAAVKVKSVLVSIVTSLGVVLLPRITFYLEKNMSNEFIEVTNKATCFVIILAFPLLLYFIIFAREAILFLSGHTFLNSVPPMQILMPTLLLIGLSNIMGIQILVPLEKEKLVLYSVAAGAVVNLILNIALIPKYAAIGAAIGTLVAELVVCSVQFFMLKKMMIEIFRNIHYKVIIIALFIGGLSSIWMKLLELNNFLVLLLSAFIFFGVYLIILIILKEPLVEEIIQQIRNKILLYKER